MFTRGTAERQKGVADSGYEATAQSFENSFRISQIHTAIQQRRQKNRQKKGELKRLSLPSGCI
jgi:hypothetical protein